MFANMVGMQFSNLSFVHSDKGAWDSSDCANIQITRLWYFFMIHDT